MTSIVALIPARAGSKRISGKNTRILAGHPLLAYTIACARAAGIFEAVTVSSESEETLEIAERYGAMTIRRPSKFAQDDSPDILFVEHALRTGADDAFAILRPTSPLRTAQTVREMWRIFQQSDAHSIRAMAPCREHPAKQWQ